MPTLIYLARQSDQDAALALARLQPTEKLADFLLRLSAREALHGHPGTRVPLPMGRGDIADHLGIGDGDVNWFEAAQLVVAALAVPILSRLGDLHGHRRVLITATLITAAGGWLVFAVGAAAAGRCSARIGVARTAILGRILNSLGAVAMGLTFGPVALVVTYFVTYSMHGFGGPAYNALLHREASARNRATVLSLASMTMFAAFATFSTMLGVLAEHTSTPVAMVVAGAAGLGGVLCFLPALRAERERASVVIHETAPA